MKAIISYNLPCYVVFLSHHLGREKFSISAEKITVEDDSDTEVDQAVFAELCKMEGICFVIKDSHDNGK